ncbi:porin [Halomonas sp. HP20-15]|uniref:porin n=1 Tax=Halomonas sp. HP20-15 TaxID=3085901 RepID=UPI002980BC84|nr:porin [Halomonas sp. HP20-15]MDW5377414.1 porin [Halomonas sp. HP20-15]
MKKTLLATAIAGAMCASAAQAATVYNQDGTQVDLYGNVQLGYRSVDTGDGSVDDIFDNGTTLGVAAEHQVNPGLIAYLKLELDGFAGDELKSTPYGSGDTAYAGMKGNFGDVKLGSYDTLIDDWVKDPVDGSWYAGVYNSASYLAGDNNDREGDQLTYKSPSFGGLQFAVGTQYKGDAETDNRVESDSTASFFGGVKYTVGALDLAAVYDNLGTYDGTVAGNGDYDAGDAYGLSAQYAMAAWTLSAKYERYDGTDDTEALTNVDNANMYAVKANYAYGMGNLYATYQYVDQDLGDNDSESLNQVMLGADYSLTSAVTYFVEGTMYDEQDDEGDFVATGLAFTF